MTTRAKWRRLKVGEIIRDGDQFQGQMGAWRKCAAIGCRVQRNDLYRRRVKGAK